MPFDFITDDNEYAGDFGPADFTVSRSPTKLKGKDYVTRDDTGQVIGIVGSNSAKRTGFKPLLSALRNTVADIVPEWMDEVQISTQISRGGAYCLEKLTFPRQATPIESKRHQTTLLPQVIYWSSLDASTSNNSVLGAVDFFCTNTHWRGELQHFKKKSTKNFTEDSFAREIEQSKDTFMQQVNYCQRMAQTEVTHSQIEQVTKDLFKEKRAKEMMMSIMDEVSVRGSNVFAIHSAFTQYGSHSSRFGFRDTKLDNLVERQFNRGMEVAKWLEHPIFQAQAA
tara:strand:+ start:473 stop:1318 length:846 start_codon:yes stop_codon:yes gene_type:complete